MACGTMRTLAARSSPSADALEYLSGTLSKIASEATIDDRVFVNSKVQQHGLLQPLIDDPLTVLLLCDANLSAVEELEAVIEGARQGSGGRCCLD